MRSINSSNSGLGLNIIYVGCFLGVLCVSLLAHAGDDKTLPAQWSIASSDVKINKSVTAWLAVQPLGSAQFITITVGTPYQTSISASQKGLATCAPQTNQRIVCQVPNQAPALLEFAITPQSAGTMRLLAVIEYGKDVSPPGYVVTSDPINIRSRLEFGPTVIAVVSALFGLIAGMITQLVTSKLQQNADDRKRKNEEDAAVRKIQREVEQGLLTGLAPEILSNQSALKKYLDNGGDPPKLSVEKYNTLMQNKAVLGYLDTPSRQSYVKAIDALYLEVKTYHSKINRQEAPDVIRAEAVRLLNTLKGVEVVS